MCHVDWDGESQSKDVVCRVMQQHGEVEVFGLDGQDERFGTTQCCHCGAHFKMVKGSGKVRGYCFRCKGIFCGSKCEVCIPKEKQLDIMEESGGHEKLRIMKLG